MARSKRKKSARSTAQSRREPPRALVWGGLAAAFVTVALGLAAPALDGEFLSDDFIYIVNNPYVQGLSFENLKALLDPWGSPTIYTRNYAPVHLLAHAAEWELFGGEATRGWHVVNAVAHGLTSLLLVPLFTRSGLSRRVALFGAALFLVHPANAEVVCWIFQLKTILALALSLGALLLLERRPAWAAALFGLALFTKITAAALLPIAAVQLWVRGGGERPGKRWAWLALWTALLVLALYPEMAAFQRQIDAGLEFQGGPFLQARTIVAIAMRYLVMAATSSGVATFHQPPLAESLLDPWWLAGVVVLGLLGARTVIALRARSEEAIYWVMAAAGFAPVSQVFPFLFPMGDRYLYPLLPGLIGGALLAARPLGARLEAMLPARPMRAATALAAALLLVTFAGRSAGRAPAFTTTQANMMDSARRYPDGMQAALLRGYAAAAQGNAALTAAEFGFAVDRGYMDLLALLGHPNVSRLRAHPQMRRVLIRLANRDIARFETLTHPDQTELMRMGVAHYVRGDSERALAVLEVALAAGDAFDAEIESLLGAIRETLPNMPRASKPEANEPEAAD